ncbi:hypothetical protein MBM_01811 [Drepanopeziza brunnea f. sp. 'multigermtubi' MB_m1]|uniref:Uncharacterized protein n=1 Tax=Marssonina brunnea f. sp. multigermtubi (strain MB_m1) TaxID=1072389 RepID=K1Y3T9_MARBU|nr:uncharacterized protein MBM_01811 [Drepanopeziza brunnea f. sp. 'multigermtubi' MB_m1]EKD19859.1 hypothetical protein MBM_01811 [Drepanopeziza brunnea f. sp. 'multigermtubi' MB_m1]
MCTVGRSTEYGLVVPVTGETICRADSEKSSTALSVNSREYGEKARIMGGSGGRKTWGRLGSSTKIILISTVPAAYEPEGPTFQSVIGWPSGRKKANVFDTEAREVQVQVQAEAEAEAESHDRDPLGPLKYYYCR